MNETLTTLIAFVGFLIVFSSLVQAVQEALKGMLKLRAGIWERFLIGIYKREFGRESGSAGPDSILGRVKKLISNARTADFVGEFDNRIKRLSGNIKRTHKLINRLKRTLQTTIDDLEDPPDDPVDAYKLLLEKTNNIIDSVELRGLLGLRLDKFLKVYDGVVNNVMEKFSGALYAFHKVIIAGREKLESPKGKIGTNEVQALVSAYKKGCEDLLSSIRTVEYKISDYRMQIERKADSWLAQLNAEYKRNMLLWTFMIGLAFVLIFNADAFSIYRYLSEDSTGRSTMVERAVERSSATHGERSGELKKINTMLAGKPVDVEQTRDAIIQLAGSLQNDYKSYQADQKAEDISRLKAAAEGIGAGEDPDKGGPEKNTGDSGGGSESPEDILRDLTDQLTVEYMALNKTALDYHLDNLSSMDLPLGWIADGKALCLIYNREKKDEKNIYYGETLGFIIRKITGLLLTSFLITFGAPFWNDILKAIVGLKAGAGKKKE